MMQFKVLEKTKDSKGELVESISKFSIPVRRISSILEYRQDVNMYNIQYSKPICRLNVDNDANTYLVVGSYDEVLDRYNNEIKNESMGIGSYGSDY